MEVSPGIVQYVKERDAAKEEMKKAQDELSATQSKLYDALQRIEDLEKVKRTTWRAVNVLVCTRGDQNRCTTFRRKCCS